MNGIKSPTQSTTIRGAILVMIGLIFRMFGYEADNAMVGQIMEVLPLVIETIGAIMAIVGRFKATERVKL